MLAYDENGDLREFEECENIVVCNHCKKPYRQRTEEQVPGFRDVDDDICPYCRESNGRSGDVQSLYVTCFFMFIFSKTCCKNKG